MWYKNILQYIVDSIFPRHCINCEVEGFILCDKCYKTLDVSGVFCCPVCHIPTEYGMCCSDRCRTEVSISKHCAISPYIEDALIGSLVHQFKYAYIEDIRIVFDKMIKDFCSYYDFDADLIVAVPLHRRRFVERGYNQASHIAYFLSRHTGIVYSDILKRTIYTQQQAKLSRQERQDNVRGAFELKQDVDIADKRIIVVDDVYTTGSTIEACADVLCRAGAHVVSGFSIARG